MTQKTNTTNKPSHSKMGVAVALGISIGTALGVAGGDVAVGTAYGAVAGILIRDAVEPVANS